MNNEQWVRCPDCGEIVEVDLVGAIMEGGEVFTIWDGWCLGCGDTKRINLRSSEQQDAIIVDDNVFLSSGDAG